MPKILQLPPGTKAFYDGKSLFVEIPDDATLTIEPKRKVMTDQIIGEIASIIARLPRITYAELSSIVGISASTLKQNSKVKALFKAQNGIYEYESKYRKGEILE